ncbi:unnamed protein product [Adineta steineri]|uniref:Uncharacterized protein n=1 Tax=Adineta steineri TaxID=433720 RepID=A0A819S554_9BILA|nr:unnamed protein product [Adineta steineri]
MDREGERGGERGFEGNREGERGGERGFEGNREPGLINDIRREDGKVEGEIRGVEAGHEQREANKYENRENKDERRENQDFNQGRN